MASNCWALCYAAYDGGRVEQIRADSGEIGYEFHDMGSFIVRAEELELEYPLRSHTNKDIGYYVATVLSACALLACHNVHTAPLATSEVKRKMMARKGERMNEAWTVVLPSPPAPKGEVRGSHRSPRTHYRRGHIRTYHRGTPEQYNRWIPSVLVNPNADARVDKNYRVERRQN